MTFGWASKTFFGKVKHQPCLDDSNGATVSQMIRMAKDGEHFSFLLLVTESQMLLIFNFFNSPKIVNSFPPINNVLSHPLQ